MPGWCESPEDYAWEGCVMDGEMDLWDELMCSLDDLAALAMLGVVVFAAILFVGCVA